MMVFDEVEEQKLVLVKTTFPQNFVVEKFPTCVTCHRQLRMRTTKQADKLSLAFSDLKSRACLSHG